MFEPPVIDRRAMFEPPVIDRRSRTIIVAALIGFVAFGVLAERLAAFGAARDTLRGQAGPAGMPNDGKVGAAASRALERYGMPSLFGRLPQALPSSLMVPEAELGGPLPTLSIAADEDYLFDPEIGIYANMREIGPEWERLATASLWERGELVAGSRVGLRMHGDSTRYLGIPSFRLQFRPMYGANRITGGRFLGADAPPAAAVVVHVVRWPGHYPNIFVFEIAQRLRLPAPAFRPANVFLNGEPRGIYVLTERVMPDGWGLTHFGDNDFYMHVYKGETKRPSLAAHAQLMEWVAAPGEITLAEAAERIDVDNLTRHLLTAMFAFTTDWAQGAALLDRDDPEAKWFWLHWDLDQSFDLRGLIDVAPWQQPVMELVTLEMPRDDLEAYGIVTDDRHDGRHRGDLRRLLFVSLLHDPDYRRLFLRTVTDVFNHQLTPAYLATLLDRYAVLERAPGQYSRVDLGEYFRHRPGFMRREVGRYFGVGDPLPVRLGAPPSTTLTIDGFPHTGPFAGAYYRGQSIAVEAPADAGIDHWLVNGIPAGDARLRIAIAARTHIEPVFAEPASRR